MVPKRTGLRAATREGLLQCAFATPGACATCRQPPTMTAPGSEAPQKGACLRDGRWAAVPGSVGTPSSVASLRAMLVAKTGEGAGLGRRHPAALARAWRHVLGSRGGWIAPAPVSRAIAIMASQSRWRQRRDPAIAAPPRVWALRRRRIDGYRLQAQFRRGAENADGDLSAIGDEQLAGDHGDGGSRLLAWL